MRKNVKELYNKVHMRAAAALGRLLDDDLDINQALKYWANL